MHNKLTPVEGVSCCNVAFEYCGEIYAGRAYDFWDNKQLLNQKIVFYKRKTGERVLEAKSHRWPQAIKELQNLLYK